MSQEIKTAVDKFLSDKFIIFKAVLIGEMTREGNWQCDAWNVSFVRSGKKETMHENYYTGIGLRKKNNFKDIPQKPSAADVLYSLLSDATARHESFNDWCENFGMDNDSIKAFTTYQACCAIGEKMAKIFSSEEMEQLRELLQDY